MYVQTPRNRRWRSNIMKKSDTPKKVKSLLEICACKIQLNETSDSLSWRVNDFDDKYLYGAYLKYKFSSLN